MNKMKYIVWDTPMCEKVIIFSGVIDHGQMAIDLGLRLDSILGAGFINSRLECWGQSVSLKRDSRGEVDSKLVQAHFRAS